MSLGVHFALHAADEARLLAADSDEDVIAIVEEIEEAGVTEHCDTDKAWDAIHRALTDGRLEYTNGTFPLNLVILGGRQLIDEMEYTVSYVSTEEVAAVAEALDIIEEEWFRARYYTLDPADYGMQLSEDDFEYTWESVQDLREFFGDAAKAGRAVIFTVDA